jgi:regulator of sigma E protease
MNILLGVIIGIIVLTILVVAHEFGHALVARRYGTVVEEFGIGFPPKAWSKKLPKSILGKNVEYSVNWLPLGGFIRLKGEHDDDNGQGDYGTLTFWQKTQVLFAGVIVNWLLAVVLLTVLALVGMPKVLPDQFHLANDATIIREPVELSLVSKNMPAEKAGLKVGDKIKTFDGIGVETPEMLSRLSAAAHGKTVTIDYQRGGKDESTRVTLRDSNTDKAGYLGTDSVQRELIRSTWSAPIVGVGTTVQMTAVTLQGVGQMIWNGISGLAMKLVPDQAVQTQANAKLTEVSAGVAGPVAIFGMIFPAAEKMGLSYILMIAAVISLTLAVMNALPIPALDGGRWFVTALYRLRKKTLTKETEEKIHGTGFLMLMVLVILVTIADIGKFR